MNNTTAATPMDPRSVGAQMSELDNQIEVLGNVISGLADALDPILEAEGPVGATPAEKEQPRSCNFADRVFEARARLTALTDRLRSMRGRVGL